ncbi:cell division control protein 42 homolog [Lytechinus variegatus]|uniref:cell division control protein 42 homolog n=1 Tax=Lytechinus variegatus TaxID=7654 RepID=UPI001BB1989D|nr:cell division control protein 42 homolog [Lytechinus variegatus]
MVLAGFSKEYRDVGSLHDQVGQNEEGAAMPPNVQPRASATHPPSTPSSLVLRADSDEDLIQCDTKLKCVLVGDGAVGKTSLVVSYTTNGYPVQYVPTAFDNYSVVIRVDEKPIKLQICDTAGQDDFDSLRPLCYPQTDVFLLCFSVVSPTSFHNVLEKWLPELRRHNPKTPILLIGTQCDLRTDVNILIDLSKHQERPICEEEASMRASRINAVGYIECSALTQHNLKEVFDAVILTGLEYTKPPKSSKSLRRRLSRKEKIPPPPKRAQDTKPKKKGTIWKKLCCIPT